MPAEAVPHLRGGEDLAARAEGREFEQLYQLFNEYKSYCYDSARYYAYECLNLAEAQDDAARIVEAKNALAF